MRTVFQLSGIRSGDRVARMRDAILCQKLVGKEVFFLSLSLNNHVVMLKELNVAILQCSFFCPCVRNVIVLVFPWVTFVCIM